MKSPKVLEVKDFGMDNFLNCKNKCNKFEKSSKKSLTKLRVFGNINKLSRETTSSKAEMPVEHVATKAEKPL